MSIFIRQISITGGAAQKLLPLLRAAGYKGNGGASEIVISSPDGDIYLQESSAASAATGGRIGQSQQLRLQGGNGSVDLDFLWIFTVGTINVDFFIQYLGSN